PLPAARPAVTVPWPTASRSASGAPPRRAALIWAALYSTPGGLLGLFPVCPIRSSIHLMRVVPSGLRKCGFVWLMPRSRGATATQRGAGGRTGYRDGPSLWRTASHTLGTFPMTSACGEEEAVDARQFGKVCHPSCATGYIGGWMSRLQQVFGRESHFRDGTC